MNADKTALAAAVVGGYVLGRTKKGKLAVTAVTYLVGRRLGGPRQLAAEGMRRIGEVPQVADLGEQIRSEGVDAVRNAVTAVAGRRMGALADKVSSRAAGLTGKDQSDEDEGDDEARDEAEGEEPDDEPEEEPEDNEPEDSEPEAEDEAEEEPPRHHRRGRNAGTGAPAKKTAKKAVPAKKAAAKKTAPEPGKPPRNAPPRSERRR